MGKWERSIRAEKLCRRCINEKYGLKLQRQDCTYWIYPVECPACTQLSSIVTGLTPSGRRRLFWSRIFPRKG